MNGFAAFRSHLGHAVAVLFDNLLVSQGEVQDELRRTRAELDLLKISNPLGLCPKHNATIRCDMPCPMCVLDGLEYGEHIADYTEDGWTLEHPLECRKTTGLAGCPVNKAIAEGGPPRFLGRYRITINDNDVVNASKL